MEGDVKVIVNNRRHELNMDKEEEEVKINGDEKCRMVK